MTCIYNLVLHNIILVLTMCSMPSCTVNISQVHTEGQATDIIDDTTSQQPELSADLGAL